MILHMYIMSLVVFTASPPFPLSLHSHLNVFLPASSACTSFIVYLCFLFVFLLFCLWPAGRGQGDIYWSVSCTLENMAFCPLATINCQWRLREKWILIPHPHMWFLGVARVPIPREYDVYIPLSTDNALVLFPKLHHLLWPGYWLKSSSLCDWSRWFRRWAFPEVGWGWGFKLYKIPSAHRPCAVIMLYFCFTCCTINFGKTL